MAVIFCCCNSRTCMWLLYFVVATVERAIGCYCLLLHKLNVHVAVIVCCCNSRT